MRQPYPEIKRRRPAPEPPEFPDACPVCGAGQVEQRGWDGVEYGCDGAYEPKPQIQSTWDVWWGGCPLGADQAEPPADFPRPMEVPAHA